MVMTPAAAGAKAVATVFANVVIGRLHRELDKKYRMWKSIERESLSLKAELDHLAAAADDMQIKVGPRTAVARVYCEEIRELTHDIEDCIERFLHRIACKPWASRARRCAHAFRMVGTRVRFAAEIKQLKNRVEEARQRAKAADSALPLNEMVVERVGYAQDCCHPVGIEKATEEVRTLLDVEPNKGNTPNATPLRVVAVVGFGGSGKTTLARAVYETVQREGALPCAWVEGSSLGHKDAKAIVQHIKAALQSGESFLAHDHKNMESRFFIVIDDVKDNAHLMDYWDTLMYAFRDNGRIIVTTTTQSIANSCCNHPPEDDRRTFGRVYHMRSLEEKDSMEALMGSSPPPDLVEKTKGLLKKCGGLPLALTSVARRLRSEPRGKPIGKFCNILCNDLGAYLEREDEPTFARLRFLLRENYTSLPDYTVRTCLLYLGIFPMDHPLKKNVLIRRWLAEGYARHPEGMDRSLAEEYFEKFVKRSIIMPVVPVSNTTGKTCKTLSIMHVFMLHKCMSMKLIMPFCDWHKKVRHFFIHGENSGMVRHGDDLSRVRSLTVLGNAGDAISNFSKYKLIRVLDLEGCIDVNDGHVKHICKLWNLRYLSLGPNITVISKKIAQLKLLETLDLSKTRVNVLPVQAIGLPCLIHLIGKFKFQDTFKTGSLPKECMLETIAGFVADKGKGFLQLMDRMKRLNKVKIWCEREETEQGQVHMNTQLSKAIQKYVEIRKGTEKFRSLSLDFQELPQGSLSALDQVWQNCSPNAEHTYHLSSLKLHGNSNSDTLRQFLGLFQNLTKLSLLSTTVWVTQQLLDDIGKMSFLSYLKITADTIEDLFIRHGKFASLKRLCLVLKTVRGRPSVLKFEDGGGPEITILQLICKDLVGISGIELSRLPKLEEIALHPKVADQTRKELEVEARKHHNRPSVLFVQGDLEEATNAYNITPTPKRKNGFHVSEAQEGGDNEALLLPKKRKQDKEPWVMCAAQLQNMSLATKFTGPLRLMQNGESQDHGHEA